MNPRPFLQAILSAACLLVSARPGASAPKAVFESPVISVKTPGHAVPIDVDVAGAKKLFLMVRDGGDGLSCDWADWVNPVLVGDSGEKKLTELKWVKASVGWGAANVNRNSAGGEMRVAGRAVMGFAAHAPSLLEFDLPPGTKRFKAIGAIDEGGSKQGGSTVQFAVFTEKPVFSFAPSGPGGAQDPEQALAGLDVAPGLEAGTFASEPMLLSPSAIDVDSRGRVWVAEIVNYRGHNGERPEGDRILILEDTDHDGKADLQKVFFQSREIDSPHGVCVLGNQAIVSASGSIHRLIDTDGDDKADRHELLFTGIDGAQHDHGTHQVMFGPDGRLYFNIGNEGGQIRDKDGRPIIDLAGNEIAPRRQPYQQGLVFRCEPDGTNVETLGWCFRNNWEVTVDSFGTIWQSDNDDDGNQGVRINYVMEFGNYGYVDELTGAGWQSPRSNLEPEIPRRHWHLNDPGVVPNLLQTGGGSPTGIMIYEGSLLPPVFRNQIIHCDAGPNVVRAYPVEKAGAGYTARIVNLVEGVRDKWFRPSDVVAAPDGSLFIADWYDPGVGGHGMGDLDHGRIYRVAPVGVKYTVPAIDLTTPKGAADALKSPALSTRHLAYVALRAFGASAEPALLSLWKDDNPRFRARAIWLLGQLDAPKYVAAAIADANPDLRITGLRLARRMKLDVVPLVARVVGDADPQVRREGADSLRHQQSSDMPKLWAALAARHDGRDRWYLEALGIGADKQWDACLEAYLAVIGGEEKIASTAGASDVIWRSRAARSPALIARLMTAPDSRPADAPRYLRALDFQAPEPKQKALDAMLAAIGKQPDRSALVVDVIGKMPSFDYGGAGDEVKAAVRQSLASRIGSDEYFDFVDRFGVRDQDAALIVLVRDRPAEKAGVQALRQLLKWNETAAVDRLIQTAGDKTSALLGSIGVTGTKAGIDLLANVVTGEATALRGPAVEALGRSRGGEQALVALATENKLPDDAKSVALRVFSASSDSGLRDAGIKALAMAVKIPEGIHLPPIAELSRRTGDAEQGKVVFTTLCQTCHQIGAEGVVFGPALTEIGSKLPKEGLYASIIDPNQAISFGYDGWTVETKDGTSSVGLITSETDADITLRAVGGIDQKISKATLAKREKLPISLMTPLAPTLTEAQLVDLVEYLAAQKKK